MATINRSFTLDEERDADILKLLDSAGPRQRSALVREALRRYAQDQEPELYEEVYRACREAVRRELAGRLVTVERGQDSGVILATPESAAAQNLARLDETLKEW